MAQVPQAKSLINDSVIRTDESNPNLNFVAHPPTDCPQPMITSHNINPALFADPNDINTAIFPELKTSPLDNAFQFINTPQKIALNMKSGSLSTPEFQNPDINLGDRNEEFKRQNNFENVKRESLQFKSNNIESTDVRQQGPFLRQEQIKEQELKQEVEEDGEEQEEEEEKSNSINIKEIMANKKMALEAFLEAGTHFLMKGQIKKAITCYERLLMQDQENGPIHNAIAHCHLVDGNQLDALKHFQKALNYLPDIRDPNLWIGIAIAYEQLNNPHNASQAYARVNKLAPNFPQTAVILFHLGCNLQIQNKVEEAIMQYKNAMLLEFEDIDFKVASLLHIGNCYEKIKDITNATSSYLAALNFNKQSVKVVQKLAWVYFQQGNIAKSIETLQESLNYDSRNSSTHYMLGRCFMRNEEFLRAHKHFESSIKYQYTNPQAWCSCGVLYAQMGQLRQALECFRVGTSQESRITELWYNIGVLYENNGQITPAYFAYSQSIEKDPKFEMAVYRRTLISTESQMQELFSLKSKIEFLDEHLLLLSIQNTLLTYNNSNTLHATMSYRSRKSLRRRKHQKTSRVQPIAIKRDKPYHNRICRTICLTISESNS